MIFFMVDDPSRIATFLPHGISEALIALKKVQKSEQVVLWSLLHVSNRAGA